MAKVMEMEVNAEMVEALLHEEVEGLRKQLSGSRADWEAAAMEVEELRRRLEDIGAERKAEVTNPFLLLHVILRETNIIICVVA